MKKKIIDYRDLTDSREILTAKTPTFITIFIILVLIILITGFIWLWVGEIDTIVRATGVVRPGETISIIRNARAGTVDLINYYPGQQVVAGELLYALDTETLKSEENLVEQIIADLQLDIDKLEILETALKNNENMFNQDDEYHNRYLNYQNQREQLQITYDQARNRYEKEKSLGEAAVSRSRLEELRVKLEVAALELNNYKLEMAGNIKEEIKNKRKELKQQLYRLEEIKSEIDLSRIEAPISGEVQMKNHYNEGDYISAGVEVLNLIPTGDTELTVELIVENKDISKLKQNQQIKYRFQALPYREYGVLTGIITHIAGDASLQMNNDNKSFPYEARATIEGSKLENNRGEQVSIRTGMICEARIVTGSRKLLYIVLEKLDFLS